VPSIFLKKDLGAIMWFSVCHSRYCISGGLVLNERKHPRYLTYHEGSRTKLWVSQKGYKPLVISDQDSTFARAIINFSGIYSIISFRSKTGKKHFGNLPRSHWADQTRDHCFGRLPKTFFGFVSFTFFFFRAMTTYEARCWLAFIHLPNHHGCQMRVSTWVSMFFIHWFSNSISTFRSFFWMNTWNIWRPVCSQN
jgi:hypothetical protein